jgi:threonine dehydratase
VTRPTLDGIGEARTRIGGRARQTPVLELTAEDTGVDARLLLKLELLQHTGRPRRQA